MYSTDEQRSTTAARAGEGGGGLFQRAASPQEDEPERSLALAACAAEGLADHLAEDVLDFEGPWWLHPDPEVRRLGRLLDESACALSGVSYKALRRLAQEDSP